MLTLIARLPMKKGKEEEAIQEIEKLVGPAREEPGTLVYLCHRPKDQEGHLLSELVFFEIYADQDALAKHANSAHVRRFFDSYEEFFEGDKDHIQFQLMERITGFSKL
jgi:quinol monooxygenase YgiN